MTDSNTVTPAMNALGAYCRELRDTAHLGLNWLATNRRGQNVDAQVKQLRQQCVEARRLDRAANRKMCIGVFGPSQAGKSYLISALARQGAKPLTAMFGTKEVNFLDDINPQGGKESTGLVTRFTIDRPVGAPPGDLAELRLFTEQDIIKLLANSYTHDIDHADEDDESHKLDAIEDALIALEKTAVGERTSKLDEVDITEIETYCDSRLRKAPRIKVVQRSSFWKVATRIAPYLPLNSRAALFAILWDNIAAFTNVYTRMAQALAEVGYAQTVYAKFEEALQERSKSLITVDTLSGIGEGTGDSVSVITPDGRSVRVLRPELAAITAELRIVMKDKPFDFFDGTDLLDFPGYRSRGGVTKEKFPKYHAENGMREFMIRGKVAYLFERYSEEKELTSVLLCHGPENFEVLELLPTIYDWIKETNGAAPQYRSVENTSLFFVMTKYDRVFEQSSGKAEDASRFHARLENNLLNSYGKHTFENGTKSWVHEWLPGKAFNNVYLLRNPAIIQDNLFDYESGVEKGLRSDKKAYVDTLRRAFVSDATIQQFHGNPDKAWDAMMKLNDGGVALIAERLRPLCNPTTKLRQVAEKADRLRKMLDDNLRPFFYSGDLSEELKKKRKFVQTLGTQLRKCVASKRFAEFLSAFQLDPSNLYSVYETVERRPIETKVAASQTVVETEEAAESLESLLGLEEDDAPSPPPAIVENDMPSRFAAGVLEQWNENLLRVANDAQLAQYFSVSSDSMLNLTQELLQGAARTGTCAALVEATRTGASFRNIPKSSLIWKQAKPAAQVINDFVGTLGAFSRQQPEGRRIEIGGKTLTIFAAVEPVDREPLLKEQRSESDRTYSQHWLAALLELVQGNVEDQSGRKIDVEANELLGEHLIKLGKAVPAVG